MRTCLSCGAKMVKYKFHLNKGLVSALMKMWRYTGGHVMPVKVAKIGLTHHQFSNFTKLRYWNLIQESYDVFGVRIKGAWHMTKLGQDFIFHGIAIPSIVITYRGEVLETLGEMITAREKLPEFYQQAEDYAREAESMT